MIREICVYENERYSPVTGFGSQGLMIADRGAYSNEEGSLSWPSTEAASLVLLSAGWSWVPESVWSVDTNAPNTDAEGWSYAVNFGSISTTASSTKGIAHFVRRRRLIRHTNFDVARLCNTNTFTCDHCELEETQRLSTILLESLASASLVMYGDRSLTDVETVTLKNKLVDTLQLQIQVPLGLTALDFALQRFAAPDRSTLSKMFGSSPTERLPARCEELNQSCFTLEEREELSRAIIRKHDAEHRVHCAVVACGSACIFSVESCLHAGCSHRMSRKWRDTHDAQCAFKLIPCDRRCGEEVARGVLDNHKTFACALRPAKCPFACIGCLQELTHREVEAHVESCTQSHLMLAMLVIQDQQSAIAGLGKKLRELEVEISAHGIQVGTLATASAANAEAVRSVDRAWKQSHGELLKADKALNRRVDDVKADVRSDVAAIRKDMRVTETAVAALKAAIPPTSAATR